MILDSEEIQAIEKRRKSFFNKTFLKFDAFVNKYRKPKRKKLIVGLLITDRCNLNCVYCYEKYKKDKSASLETLKGIVKKVLQADSIWTHVEFRLLGGEPFLHSDLIKDLVDWSLKKKWDKKISFHITTNGTCIRPQMKKWLIENKKYVKVILSLDGPSYVQNNNRPNSYLSIDFDFFAKYWPELPVKMTVSKSGIQTLYNSVRYIHEKLNLKVSFNLAGGEKWNEEDFIVFEREQKKIFEFYRDKGEIPKIYNIQLSKIYTSTVRQCGIGYDTVVYDMDGNPYACHLLLPNVMGNQKIPNISYFRNDSVLRDAECENCIIDKICPTCYAYNIVERGKACERNHNLCKFYLSIIKFAIKYKTKFYHKKKFYTSHEMQEIEAILLLHEKMEC